MTKFIKAREWLVRAEQDLKYARLVLPNHSDLFEVALYHCQQCAEKSLKGYLVYLTTFDLRKHIISKL